MASAMAKYPNPVQWKMAETEALQEVAVTAEEATLAVIFTPLSIKSMPLFNESSHLFRHLEVAGELLELVVPKDLILLTD